MFFVLMPRSFPEAMGRRDALSKSLRSFLMLIKSSKGTKAGSSAVETVTASGSALLQLAVRVLARSVIDLAAEKIIDGDEEARFVTTAQKEALSPDTELYPGESSDIARLIDLVDPTGCRYGVGGGVSESKSDGHPESVAELDDDIRSEVMSCVDASGQRLSDELVYRAVLCHVVGSTGAMPCPAQISWVDSQTSSQDVIAFVQRASAFPSLRFAMVGVNNLRVSAREELMRAVLCRRGRLAQLALVLTDSE